MKKSISRLVALNAAALLLLCLSACSHGGGSSSDDDSEGSSSSFNVDFMGKMRANLTGYESIGIQYQSGTSGRSAHRTTGRSGLYSKFVLVGADSAGNTSAITFSKNSTVTEDVYDEDGNIIGTSTVITQDDISAEVNRVYSNGRYTFIQFVPSTRDKDTLEQIVKTSLINSGSNNYIEDSQHRLWFSSSFDSYYYEYNGNYDKDRVEYFCTTICYDVTDQNGTWQESESERIPITVDFRPEDTQDSDYYIKDYPGEYGFDERSYYTNALAKSFVIDNQTGYIYAIEEGSVYPRLIKDNIFYYAKPISYQIYSDIHNDTDSALYTYSVGADDTLNFEQIAVSSIAEKNCFWSDCYGNNFIASSIASKDSDTNSYFFSYDGYDFTNSNLYRTTDNEVIEKSGNSYQIFGENLSSSIASGTYIFSDRNDCYIENGELKDIYLWNNTYDITYENFILDNDGNEPVVICAVSEPIDDDTSKRYDVSYIYYDSEKNNLDDYESTSISLLSNVTIESEYQYWSNNNYKRIIYTAGTANNNTQYILQGVKDSSGNYVLEPYEYGSTTLEKSTVTLYPINK